MPSPTSPVYGSVTPPSMPTVLRRCTPVSRSSIPHDDIWTEPVFAGAHRLNGSGEMTGLEWIRESGELTTAIGLTNTHSVGVVRDELVAAQVAGPRRRPLLVAARRRRDL